MNAVVYSHAYMFYLFSARHMLVHIISIKYEISKIVQVVHWETSVIYKSLIGCGAWIRSLAPRVLTATGA